MKLPNGIGVIGDGRLAVAIAHMCAASERPVCIWVPDEARRTELAEHRRLAEVLPEVERIDERVRIASGLDELAAASRLVMLITSGSETERTIAEAGHHLDGSHQVVHAHHRLHGADLHPTSELIRNLTCCLQIGALAGPVHVRELLRGQANAVVVGSAFPDLIDRIKGAIVQRSLRIYSRKDLVGVEVAAALVQLIAVAVGVSDGLGLGTATHATLMVRGLAEATRMGKFLGATPDTFAGLAGLGRLLDWARAGEANYDFGVALARAESIESAAARFGVEGQAVHMIGPVRRFADKHGVWMPITRVLDEIVAGNISAAEALDRLLKTEVPSED